MEHVKQLAKEFSLKEEYAQNILELIDQGNTIPFIARYRKEMHGSCDDQVLREFADRAAYLTSLDKRKEEVANAITEQGKFTDDIAIALTKAITLTEVEDIYRPYKQKKKTRASVAIARGLQPLADTILLQTQTEEEVALLAEQYLSDDIASIQDAINGAKDIIAEMISDNAELRKALRAETMDSGKITTKLLEKENSKTYDMYKEYEEKVNKIPSHRILAINRGEKEGCLKVAIAVDKEIMLNKITSAFVKGDAYSARLVTSAGEDSFDRLIFPSIEREIRSDLTDKADEQAIKMFEVNLKPLLLQPPLKGKRIMAVDPAYRTGCKIAVIDEKGEVLDTGVVYATPPQSKVEESKAKLTSMILKHKVNVISIGNGTATKEAEIFVVDLIKQFNGAVSYAVVNEAGASVYSASKLGATEFPELDVSLRSAVSIARRLQDPLAELIKIDVKSIGVGQYQHDMPEARLSEVLGGVVEDCVNSVGVDINTASVNLLTFVAGLNSGIAKNIVEYRKSKPFESRNELLKVSKLGPKAYEQCAGFLRIPTGKYVLDNTSVHPESYPATQILLDTFGYAESDVALGKLTDIREKATTFGKDKLAKLCNIGVPTLDDILTELVRPGRDIRDSLPPAVLRSDLMDLNDLKPGMEVEGTVRNVIDFGVFVDIGVHQDGLVHISQIADGYIKHPSEVLTVGQRVLVKVMEVDPVKKKIALTLKTSAKPNGMKLKTDGARQN
ncbi:MAG: Tex family protein, partial [Clostridia bacterium]